MTQLCNELLAFSPFTTFRLCICFRPSLPILSSPTLVIYSLPEKRPKNEPSKQERKRKRKKNKWANLAVQQRKDLLILPSSTHHFLTILHHRFLISYVGEISVIANDWSARRQSKASVNSNTNKTNNNWMFSSNVRHFSWSFLHGIGRVCLCVRVFGVACGSKQNKKRNVGRFVGWAFNHVPVPLFPYNFSGTWRTRLTRRQTRTKYGNMVDRYITCGCKCRRLVFFSYVFVHVCLCARASVLDTWAHFLPLVGPFFEVHKVKSSLRVSSACLFQMQRSVLLLCFYHFFLILSLRLWKN